jgi:hypothetical protein
MPGTILERLSNLPPTEWSTRPPATPEALAALEAKYHITLPADYRELMLVTNGCGLYGHRTKLNLELADDLLWHNEDPRFTTHLPGMFVIGDDNGDSIFYFDPTNHLEKSAYAVFMVELGVIGFPYSKYAAPTFAALIDAILDNRDIWDNPYLGPLTHPDRAD